tara:strand:+ start:384 stop:773 length:390 start_codon:yes stop_codon:yes gene_type:complete
MDVIPTVAVDPYTSLASRYKLGYTYSFQTDFMTGEEYLVREVPIHSNYLRMRDPLYKDLNDPDFKGEEFSVNDSFPRRSIVNDTDLDSSIKNKCPEIECDVIRVHQDHFSRFKRTFSNSLPSKRFCHIF